MPAGVLEELVPFHEYLVLWISLLSDCVSEGGPDRRHSGHFALAGAPNTANAGLRCQPQSSCEFWAGVGGHSVIQVHGCYVAINNYNEVTLLFLSRNPSTVN